MDPELRKKVEEIHKLAKENNEMLHRVRGVQKRNVIFMFIKWCFIIGISLGIFYFFQPYVDSFKYFVEDTGEILNNFKETMPR